MKALYQRGRSEGSGTRRDVKWSFLTNLLLTGATTLTGVLTARLLGPSGRGQLALVMLWPTLLASLLAIGFPQAFAFHAGRNPMRTAGLTKLALACALVQGSASVLVALIVFPFVLRAQSPATLRLAILFALTAPAYIASGYLMSIVQGCGRVRMWNVLRGVSTTIYLLGVAIAWAAGMHEVLPILLVVAAGHFCTGAATLAVLLRTGDWSQPPAWDLFDSLLHYGIRNFLAGVSWLANTRLDQMLMTWFLEPKQIGFYVAAVSLTGVLSSPAQAIASVTLPRVAMSTDAEAAGIFIRRAVRGTAALLVPGAGLMYLSAPWLLVHVYGKAFQGGAQAAQLLALGTVALGLNQVISDALRGLGRPLGPALGEMTGLIVSFVALWQLLPRFGIVGAAIASVASYCTVLSVLMWYVHRTFGGRGRLTFPAASPSSARPTTQDSSVVPSVTACWADQGREAEQRFDL